MNPPWFIIRVVAMILTPIRSSEISNVKSSGHHMWIRRLGRGRGRGQTLRCPGDPRTTEPTV